MFGSLIQSFIATGGVPREILFDNMRSIVDIVDGKRRINSKARQFAKDFGFKIKLAKPRHSFTKGKVETINKFVRIQRQLLQELGREPYPEEIAKEMEIGVDRVREIMKIAQEPVSLETPIGEEEDSHLGDFIEDHDAPAPADAASFLLLKEQLEEVLDTLTPREEKVLRLRFGLDDGRARTLEEVGQNFGVTRERIRQIEAKALRKLRHPSRSHKLKDFLD